MARYTKNQTIVTDDTYYKNLLESRDSKNIFHYKLRNYASLTPDLINSITYVQDIWKEDSKLYKFSHKYYGSLEYWWVIGAVNRKPTDAHWKIGEKVYIPTDIQTLIQIIGI